MLIGYARVSSLDQDTAMQRAALAGAGVDRLFEEVRSAGKRRPLLEAVLYCLRAGDVLVVYKLDRLARSLSDLLRILGRLRAARAGLRSLTESIDTTTAAGVMMVQLLGTFAEFERSMIRERSMAGQDRAYAAGVKFGRRRAMSASDEAECVRLHLVDGVPRVDLARRYGCHVMAVTRAVLRVTTPHSSAVRSKWRQSV